jgi:hypothetical protein
VASIDKINGSTDELEGSTHFEYDSVGNLVLLTADRNETEFQYDQMFGLLSRTARFDGEILSKDEYVYDAFGNLIRSETTINLMPVTVNTFNLMPVPVNTINLMPVPSGVLFSDVTAIANFREFGPVSSLSTAGGVIVASSLGVQSGATPLFGIPNPGSVLGSFPIPAAEVPELPPLVLSSEYQYDENGNRVVAVISSSLRPGVISTTTFTYENNRVVDIIVDTGGLIQDIDEYHIEYDAQGRLVSCQAGTSSVTSQDQLAPSTLLENFPQAVATLPVGGYLQTCTDLVNYDDLGRVIRIERPETSDSRGTVFFSGSIREIEYLGDKIVLIRVDNNADSEFEEVREFDYSVTGEVIEERIIRDGEIVFRRVREYISMELPGIP